MVKIQLYICNLPELTKIPEIWQIRNKSAQTEILFAHNPTSTNHSELAHKMASNQPKQHTLSNPLRSRDDTLPYSSMDPPTKWWIESHYDAGGFECGC